ncbi:hypothetical protein COX69_02595 [Candidatus Falkowbacteria bacterium CG_4_10_14_0_2_um_filter_48_10]|nr:MAG: hypothetical protein COX69_02595 [Candidatus Falkowbacteria bacterium CG_4_10_14_0_2_um_filter_48_10]
MKKLFGFVFVLSLILLGTSAYGGLLEGEQYRLANKLEKYVAENGYNCTMQFLFLQKDQVRYNFQQDLTNINLSFAKIDFYDLESGEYKLKVFVYAHGLQGVNKDPGEWVLLFQDEEDLILSDGGQVAKISLQVARSPLLSFHLFLPYNYYPSLDQNNQVEVSIVCENGDISSIMGDFIWPFRGSPPQIVFSFPCQINNLPSQIIVKSENDAWLSKLYLTEAEMFNSLIYTTEQIKISEFQRTGDIGVHLGYKHHQMLAQGVDDYVDPDNPVVYEINIKEGNKVFIFTDQPDENLFPIPGLKIFVMCDDLVLAESTRDEINQSLVINVGSPKLIKVFILGTETGGHFRLWVQSE